VVQPYRLIQQEFSLYSGKARAYMRYKGLDFEQQPATLNTYRRTILPRTGVAMIPVLLTPQGEALQDTTVIIETLEQRHPERGITPPGPRQRLASLLLELYGDEWLLLPAMHYRWNCTATSGCCCRPCTTAGTSRRRTKSSSTANSAAWPGPRDRRGCGG
jgi:glutathione S-transferase